MHSTSQSPSPQFPIATQFPTASRAHIGLPVSDLDASVRFYTTLLGAPPVKTREGYAKFETIEPALNLSLNATDTPITVPHSTQHFGVQVKSTDAVLGFRTRLSKGGFETADEEGVTCCYSVQDKIWAVDPDGHRWEVFVVLEAEAEAHSSPGTTTGRLTSEPAEAAAPCCTASTFATPGCCT